jgi:hypothetical protein
MAGGFWFTQILPLNQKAGKLTADIKRIEQEKRSAQSRISLQDDQLKSVVEEIKKLKEFDLRNDDPFDVMFANRSNRGLIAVTALLERHHISIETLSSSTVDQQAILIAGVPQGGVLTRKYRILAQGDYADVQAAFASLSSLPPTVEFEHYDVEAMPDSGGSRAKVAFQLDFGFNFLVSQAQFDLYTALASDSAAASGSLASALFDGSLARSIQDRASKLFGQDGVGSPRSDSASADGEPDPTNSETSASESTTVSTWLEDVARWWIPPAEAKTETSAATRKSYSFGDQRNTHIGRKEPFLPLIRTQMAPAPRRRLASASASVVPAVASGDEPDPRVVSLEGVLLPPAGPATALLSFDGQRLRVRAGSVLNDGSQVEAIGRDFLLLKQKGQIRRLGLGVPPAETSIRQSPVNMLSPVGRSSAEAQNAVLPPPIPRVRLKP